MEKKRKENAEKTQKKKREEEYEYCKICRLNHNQGRRHNFFPRHTTSLSSLLSRFLHKLSLLHSSLSNPTFFLPQHASSSSPFWCIFCDFDFDDFGSSFACGNVIKHLASDDHLKNVKHFLWKYGGGMNKVDSFRVTEAEFAKWEKKCEVLKCKATSPSGIHHGTLHGELNDIRPNYDVLNNFEKNNIPFLEPNLLNNVLPLQYNTNENYQVCRLDISEAGKAGPSYEDPGLQMAQGSEHGLNTWSSTYIDYGSTYPLPSCPVNLLADGLIHKAVHKNQSTTNGEASSNGYQSLTRITSAKLGDDKGNVYSGAPPPWLEGTDPTNEIGQPTSARSNSAQKNSRKTSKLNPNRVGAAWAEKRKRELEMEKRGEIIANTSGPDWLPNFGSVWQSGTRKESMKYFKKETVSVPKADSQSEAEIKLMPYISKRMRVGTQMFSSGGFQEAGDTS
ncbi:hypothetical protein RND81_13G095400 [Saponaria officinalis]|uniref:TITAN-like protein n=2 Tax=Saponaria officinalis TaxID=3572 RepID=A0AAW1GYN8_SAPOF